MAIFVLSSTGYRFDLKNDTISGIVRFQKWTRLTNCVFTTTGSIDVVTTASAILVQDPLEKDVH